MFNTIRLVPQPFNMQSIKVICTDNISSFIFNNYTFLYAGDVQQFEVLSRIQLALSLIAIVK